ncbi:MAG: PilW family protein [Methylococcaceae bacterium]|nr:PilW family protein [Methylococcaceae bacterium]
MSKSILKANQQGMTLIEIMIAMLLGLFLIAGVMKIYIGSKQSSRMLDNLSRMQENGRFAMDFIRRDIRQADYWGCLQNGLADVTNNTKAIYDMTHGLIGVEGASGAPDTLTMVGGKGVSIAVQSQASASANITITAAATGNELQTGEAVLITDCGGGVGDMFTVAGVTGGTVVSQDITGGQDISKAYGAGASIHHLVKSIYFIQGGALQRTMNGITTELVEDIEDMQILYGEDTDNDYTPNYYVSAGNVVDMDQVVSVRVNLLAVSADNNLTTAPVNYTFNGSTSTPSAGDHKLRREFSSTIAVRNRLP